MDSVSPIDAGPTAWPRLQKFLATADVQLLRDWQQRRDLALDELRQQQIALSEKHQEQMRLLSLGRDDPPSTVAGTTCGTALSDTVSSGRRHSGACQREASQITNPRDEIIQSVAADDRMSDQQGTGDEVVDNLPLSEKEIGSPLPDSDAAILSTETAKDKHDLGGASAITNSAKNTEMPERGFHVRHDQPAAQGTALTACAAYDQRPVKPLGDASASFEELIVQRMKEEEAATTQPGVTKPAQQKNFLRRGQGIARFNKKPAANGSSHDANAEPVTSPPEKSLAEKKLSPGKNTACGEPDQMFDSGQETGLRQEDQQFPAWQQRDFQPYVPSQSSIRASHPESQQTTVQAGKQLPGFHQARNDCFTAGPENTRAAPPNAEYNPKVYSEDEQMSSNDLESLLEFEMLEAAADDHSFSSQCSLVQGVLRRAATRRVHSGHCIASSSPPSEIHPTNNSAAVVSKPTPLTYHSLTQASSSRQAEVSRQLFKSDSHDSGLASSSTSHGVPSTTPISSSSLLVGEEQGNRSKEVQPTLPDHNVFHGHWARDEGELKSGDDTDTTLEASSQEQLADDSAWDEEVVASAAHNHMPSLLTKVALPQQSTGIPSTSPAKVSTQVADQQGDFIDQGRRILSTKLQAKEQLPQGRGFGSERDNLSDDSFLSNDQVDGECLSQPTTVGQTVPNSQPVAETLLQQKNQLHQLLAHHQQILARLKEQRRHLTSTQLPQRHLKETKPSTELRQQSWERQHKIPLQKQQPIFSKPQPESTPSFPQHSPSAERPAVPNTAISKVASSTRMPHLPAVFQETVDFADEPTPSQLVMKMFPALCPKPKPEPPAPPMSNHQLSPERPEASSTPATHQRDSMHALEDQEAVQGKIQELENYVERLVDLRLKRQREELTAAVVEFEQQRDAEFASLEQEWKKLRTERRQFTDEQRRNTTVMARRDVEIAHLKDELSSVEERLHTFQSRETRLQTALARSKARTECLEKDNEELQAENKLLTSQLLDAQQELRAVKAKVQQENVPPTRQGGYFSGSKTSRKPLTPPSATQPGRRHTPSSSSLARSASFSKTLSEGQETSTSLGQPSLVNEAGHDSNLSALRSPENSMCDVKEEMETLAANKSMDSISDTSLPSKALPNVCAPSQPAAGLDEQPFQDRPNQTGPLLEGQETVLPDGSRQITLPNGTRQVVSADGRSVVITFFNGDIKQILPDQRQVYFYAESQTTQTTYPDGIEVIEFANNQTETHYPDGTKEIHFSDGTVSYFMANGLERHVEPSGIIHQESVDGEHIIEFPNGQREVHTAEFKRRECPDGTTKTVFADGRQETRYASGRVRVKDAAGTVVLDTWADTPSSP